MLIDPSVDDANQIGTRKNRTLRNIPTVTVAAALRRKVRQRGCVSSGRGSGSHSPTTAASAHATTSSATALGAKAIVCFEYICDRMPRKSAIAGASRSSSLRRSTCASRSRINVHRSGAGGGGVVTGTPAGTESCNSPIECINSPHRGKMRRGRGGGVARVLGGRFAHPVADAGLGL